MIEILRFIGVTNAAVWLGAAVFFTFGVAPVFFSDEVRRLLNGPFWPGIVAQMALERYFVLQYLCTVIALMHQTAEWLYLGRALRRVTLGLLMGLLTVGFLGGLWLQPKLQRLYLIKNGVARQNVEGVVVYRPAPVSAEDHARAERSFRRWHGLSQVMNLLALGGLTVYLWRVTHPDESPRFVSATKFRS